MDTRTALFLFGCMGTRLAVTWMAWKASAPQLYAMGLVALAISVGFFVIWATGSRTTGPETFGERIWWNDLRPVHSALWGLFAWMALNGNHDAWKVLLLDVTIGFLAWLQHRAMK